MKKVPTDEEYRNHSGLHYHQLWKSIDDKWECPACGRNKFQIMKWTKRFPGKPYAKMDWVTALHKHHDHSVDYINYKHARFPETLICGQCNSTEGVVKRTLKLPSNFSFSPQELRIFILATPHEKHQINLDLARVIYYSLIK